MPPNIRNRIKVLHKINQNLVSGHLTFSLLLISRVTKDNFIALVVQDHMPIVIRPLSFTLLCVVHRHILDDHPSRDPILHSYGAATNDCRNPSLLNIGDI